MFQGGDWRGGVEEDTQLTCRLTTNPVHAPTEVTESQFRIQHSTHFWSP